MNENNTETPELLDTATRYDLEQFCAIARIEPALVIRLVEEGVLLAEGRSPDRWQFSLTMVQRLRRAGRLHRDLEIDLPGLALSVELLEEIDHLKREIQILRGRLGIHE